MNALARRMVFPGRFWSYVCPSRAEMFGLMTPLPAANRARATKMVYWSANPIRIWTAYTAP